MTRQSSGACAGEGPRNANPVYPMREAAVTEQRDGLASTPPFGKPPVRNLAISGVALADLSIMSMVIADTAMNTRSRLCSSSNEMSISRLTKPRAQTAVGIGGAGSLRIDSGFPHEQGIPAIIADRSVYGSSAWAPGAAYVPYGWRLQCLPDGLEGQEVAPDISELPCLLGAFNKAKKPAGLPIVRIMVTGMV